MYEGLCDIWTSITVYDLQKVNYFTFYNNLGELNSRECKAQWSTKVINAQTLYSRLERVSSNLIAFKDARNFLHE